MVWGGNCKHQEIESLYVAPKHPKDDAGFFAVAETLHSFPHRMSQTEYESDYDSEYDDSEYDSASESGSEETDMTYTSLEAALADMSARMAELDQALDTTAIVAHTLETPVTAVAVSAFTNPRVLESAPFRATKFRLKSSAKALLNTAHHTVTFAELCDAIRKSLGAGGNVLGATDFLSVLQHLPEIIE